MSDLKACPFCGRIPDIEDCGEHRWFIRCKCGIAQDKLFFQKCDAVRAWNKRKELRVKDTNAPITDTISRQAAIDAFYKYPNINWTTLDVLAEIKALPSAQPVRMKGKWVAVHDPVFADTYYCSECKEEPLATDTGWVLSKFCPYCGAEMKGAEDELQV